LPEASLKTNLEGCGEFGGVVAEAVAGRRTAQASERNARGRIFCMRAAPYSAFCGPNKGFFSKKFIIAI
jgi:hypothetical protein